MLLRLILFILAIFSLQAKNFCTLSLMAVFQNEASYLKEWIEFHRIVGVEHFLLFNHGSEDNYKEILKPYIKANIVTLIEVDQKVTGIQEWNALQCSLYMKGIHLLKNRSEWVAVLDTDEFLFSTQYDDLRRYLKKFKKAGALGVNWQLFGTSNVEKIGAGELMIDQLLWKAECDFIENRHIKSIVRPKAVLGCRNPHYFQLKKGYCTVTSSFIPIAGAITDSVDVSEVCINHYWTRDETFFLEQKIKRRKGWAETESAIIARKEALHQVKAAEILRFSPYLRARLFSRE